MPNHFRAIGATTFLSPIPAVMLSCRGTEPGFDKDNLITVAWAGVINSAPPMISVSLRPSRHSYAQIVQSGVFCLNLIDQSLCRAADFCGVKSGRDVDKFKEMHLHAREVDGFPAPALDEAPAFLCCRVQQRLPLGSHELFLCAVEDVYVKDALFDPDGSLHLGHANLVSYAHGEYFPLKPRPEGFLAIPSRGRTCCAADSARQSPPPSAPPASGSADGRERKMLKIKPIRGALALLLAVSLCLVMSLTAFLIDTPAMREHAEQAVDLLGYESASPEIVGGFASSRLDNYTAVLILKTAAYIGDDPLLRMAFSGLRTDLPPQEDQTDWEAYATYSDAVPSPNNVPYSRYWHGYTFALRLLLSLFTFTNLQMLLLFAQTALLLWTVLLMVRRGLQQLIPPFAVSWFFMSPPALGLCLQYAPVSLIALLACSLLLALKPALSRSVGLPVFFALIGLFVNYFDLLTFPVVSLSFPLILLIALETKTTISFGGLMREALLCCVGWALGYACMWLLKWGLNFLVLGQDGIAAVGDQISLRLSAGGESHSRLDILLRSIRIVTDKTAYRVILLAVLALLLALFIRRRPRRFDGRALLLLLPLLAPVLWTLALSNHASDHTYFTYRNLCGAFFALFALPALLAPDRTPSP